MLPDRIRAVCFDIGGVLVDMPRGTLADELAALLGCDVERVRRLLIEHGKSRRTNTHTLAGILAESCGTRLVDRIEQVLRDRLDDIAEPELFADAIPTLQALTDAGWRVCFLTNAIGTPDARPAPSYYSFAEAVIHSWEIGHCKPCLGAFRAVEQQMGLRPDEIVKVGDSAHFDIASARRAGWSTVHVIRNGAAAAAAASHTITSLRELPALLPQRPTRDLAGTVTADVAD